jgi:hypothetical protein
MTAPRPPEPAPIRPRWPLKPRPGSRYVLATGERPPAWPASTPSRRCPSRRWMRRRIEGRPTSPALP